MSKRGTAGISVASDRWGDDPGCGVDRRWYAYGGVRDRGSRKCALTMRAQDFGRSVGPIGSFLFVAVRLQTAAAMFPSVSRASMLSLVIVAFETHKTEVGAPEKAFERREGIAMVVVVEQHQRSVAMSVRHQRVRSRGVDDDDLLVVQTRSHSNERQFVRSPRSGTESHFPDESFGCLLSTMHASPEVDPLFTSVSILTGRRQYTCPDDGSRAAPTGVIPGHLDHRLFHLFEANARLMTGHVLAFFSRYHVDGGRTWTTERLNASSISNCSLEFSEM